MWVVSVKANNMHAIWWSDLKTIVMLAEFLVKIEILEIGVDNSFQYLTTRFENWRHGEWGLVCPQPWLGMMSQSQRHRTSVLSYTIL